MPPRPYYYNPSKKPVECSYNLQGMLTCEKVSTYPDGRPLFFMERFAVSEPQTLKKQQDEGLESFFETPLQWKAKWMDKCK